jgi:hypothetical protein
MHPGREAARGELITLVGVLDVFSRQNIPWPVAWGGGELECASSSIFGSCDLMAL